MNNYKLDFVGVRLVKENTVYYDKEIHKPMDAVMFLKEELSMLDREVVISLNIDTQGKVINAYVVAMGGMNSAEIDPKCIFKSALLSNAFSILLIHNHPSGNLTPSGEDLNLTQNLSQACKLLGLKLTDHIIVGGAGEFYSLREHKQI